MEGYFSVAKLLYDIDGFKELTEDQQQKILLSLYIQNRADRNNTASYRVAQNIQNTWNCHGAIASLEGGRKPSQELSLYPGEFFDAEYYQLATYAELEEMVIEFGLPCVLHISTLSNFRSHTYPLLHSALVLGYDRFGQLITWEKQGYKKPFRICTLENTYFGYPKNLFWGVRRLRENFGS